MISTRTQVLEERRRGRGKRNLVTVITVKMRGTIFWVIFCSSCEVVAVEALDILRVESRETEKTIVAALGTFERDGISFGSSRYRLQSDSTKRYLYRSGTKRQWTVSGLIVSNIHLRD